MGAFNKVILVGNLTRDPEVRYTPSGTAVSEIGVAVNRTWYDRQTNERREETTFVDVTLWGRQAEIAGEYLAKGRQVLIEGRLQLDQWEDRQTGQKRSKLRVVCENLQMLGSRSDAVRSSAPSAPAPASPPAAAPEPAPEPAADFPPDGVAEPPPDDDVPF
ncbi:MAG: single-stranded DNA-binding protein [Planctomycetes bacterium]|nr:single-stranded DNA-binding protein [Planctomycetota bacterium]